tara:strand:- start:3089 stop:4018 length:930 start_codon:yes stop_codon:yes gene_type:complete
MKQKLKIKYVDFWEGFPVEDSYFLNLVEDYYDIEYSENPDLLFYSCYSTNFLKYNCPRIFYSPENIRPDFRFCDFALTFDYLQNERHFRWPLYRRWFTEEELTRPRNVDQILKQKEGFCSFVVSNANASERIEFFEQLSEYKDVASGGRYANNVGGPVSNKREFIQKHLFNIAFENSSYPGYTTEKIAEPWVEGCIPIYWGDPMVTLDINPNCFINVHDFKSFDDAINYIQEVDNSEALQRQYLSAPFFRNNTIPEHLKDETIATALKSFIDQCLNGLPNKAAKFWHKPYFHLKEYRLFKDLVKIQIRG